MFSHRLLTSSEKMETTTWSFGEHPNLKKKIGDVFVCDIILLFVFFHQIYKEDISSITSLFLLLFNPISFSKSGFSSIVLHNTTPLSKSAFFSLPFKLMRQVNG